MLTTKRKSQRSTRLFLLIAISIGGSLLVGCASEGPGYVAAGGWVHFELDGTPATFGDIEFRSESGSVVVARGKIQKDGSFKVNVGNKRGTVAGSYTVVILQPLRSLVGGVKHHHGLDAHKKYADHRTTDLRVEVTAETGLHGLDLVIEESAR